MTGFWLLALAMGVVAAAFVVWPLVRARGEDRGRQIRARSNLAIFEDRLAELRADLEAGHVGEEEFASLRAELERSLLQDVDEADLEATAAPRAPTRSGRRGLLISALMVPLVAVVLYADWGLSWGALSELQLSRDMEQLDAPREEGDAAAGNADMADLASRLEARLEANPDDADGWFLLGRTRLQLGEFEAAAAAFEEVANRVPDSLAPNVFRAQALYLAEDRQLTPRVREVVDAVLAQEPGQPIMLELLAMDAFRSGRFAEAAQRFARVLQTPVRDPARREFLEDGLARARDLAGLPAAGDVAGESAPDASDAPEPGASEASEESEASEASVRVLVELDPSLDAPEGATLFVFARAVDGPPMPLAAARLDAGELPVLVTLDDSMAMMPGRSLSAADRVRIVARVTSGDGVRARPGDLEGTTGELDPTAVERVVPLLIERRIR